jgi:hypothetical protein
MINDDYDNNNNNEVKGTPLTISANRNLWRMLEKKIVTKSITNSNCTVNNDTQEADSSRSKYFPCDIVAAAQCTMGTLYTGPQQ